MFKSREHCRSKSNNAQESTPQTFRDSSADLIHWPSLLHCVAQHNKLRQFAPFIRRFFIHNTTGYSLQPAPLLLPSISLFIIYSDTPKAHWVSKDKLEQHNSVFFLVLFPLCFSVIVYSSRKASTGFVCAARTANTPTVKKAINTAKLPLIKNTSKRNVVRYAKPCNHSFRV